MFSVPFSGVQVRSPFPHNWAAISEECFPSRKSLKHEMRMPIVHHPSALYSTVTSPSEKLLKWRPPAVSGRLLAPWLPLVGTATSKFRKKWFWPKIQVPASFSYLWPGREKRRLCPLWSIETRFNRGQFFKMKLWKSQALQYLTSHYRQYGCKWKE